MTPLQKRALFGLAIGVVMTAAILAVFIVKGVTAYDEDKGMRLIVMGLFVGGLALYALTFSSTRRKLGQTEVLRDERDEVIMRNAVNVQLWSVIISLVVWMIVLSEIYWDRGQMPVIFLFLMAMSSLIVNMLAQAIGILIGYRRML
jgi:hypothetical protein